MRSLENAVSEMMSLCENTDKLTKHEAKASNHSESSTMTLR